MANQRQSSGLRHRGFTVTELLVVVIILGILATIVTPGLRSGDPDKVNLAAAYVAEALRLARGESMRTGQVYGVTISQTNQRVQVRRYDITQDPVDPVETLYHPVTKQLLDFDLDSMAPASGAEITNTQDIFNYNGLGRRRTVLFNAQGVPIWVVGAGATTWAMTTGVVELGLDDYQRNVVVAPYTGRVTVQ